MSNETKVVLLFGQTGLNKTEAGKKLACRLNKFSDISALDTHMGEGAFISFEDEIVQLPENKLRSVYDFLKILNAGKQREVWNMALESVVTKCEETKCVFSVISIHGVLNYFKHYKTFINGEFITKTKPSLSITLINDIYNIEKIINTKEENNDLEINFSYEELLAWRTVENTVADIFMGENTGNIVISAKQYINTFEMLVKKPDATKIYLSFPITDTRGEESKRGKIDEIRELLHSEFLCFDPLGIDELRFNYTDSLEILPRWKFGEKDSLDDTDVDPNPEFLNDLKSARVFKKTIGNHIRYRDFRLIDQSDCVVVIRPFSASGKMELSRGVSHEIIYANSLGIPVIIFDDNAPPPGTSNSPFDYFDQCRNATSTAELEKLIKEI